MRHPAWRYRVAGHLSEVNLELDQGSSSTTVRLTQTNIPKELADTMEADWHRFYFDRMKLAFGWGVPSGGHPY